LGYTGHWAVNLGVQRRVAVRKVFCWLITGLLFFPAMAAPTFTDQGLYAGFLNPGDTAIPVQMVRVIGDPSQTTYLYSLTVRNVGTASHFQITRIELWDEGRALATITNPVGLTSGGVTTSLSYSIPAGATRDLRVRVWINRATAISGGETIKLELKFYYTVEGATYSSPWIADSRSETIIKAGFERVEETPLPPAYFNPGNTGTAQVITWTDDDANASPVSIQRIRVQNLGTATKEDVDKLTLKLRHGGGALPPFEISDLTNWNTDGVIIEVPRLVINDGDSLVCEVEVTVSLAPTDSRTIRTKVTLEVEENAEQIVQISAASATHTIVRSGLEEIRDDSSTMVPAALNPGETLVQSIILRDNDVNSFDVDLGKVWLRNADGATATGAEIAEIRVQGPGWSFSTTDTAAFNTTGVEIPLVRVPPVPDDGEVRLTVSYRVGEVIPGHTLQPEVKVWCEEFRGASAWSPKAVYPELVHLYPAGLEIVKDIRMEPATLYSSQRVCVQKIEIGDMDQNRTGVMINPIIVRNLGTAAAGDLVKIEIRNARGDLLGETTNLASLRSSGVTINPRQHNGVPDDGTEELWIWVTVGGPERDVSGRTIRLATTLFHVEGGVGYQRTATSELTMTLAVNHPPQVDFDYTPDSPSWNSDIAFTPKVTDPEDPRGRDEIAYSKWNFGDGTVVERNGSPQQVTHRYGKDGTFEVTLTVRDDKGVEESKTKSITVKNDPPTGVDFSHSPTNPKWSDTITFTPARTIKDPDGDIKKATFKWEFGDGKTAQTDGSKPVTHKYGKGGQFNVKLTVTDQGGASASKTHTISVSNALPTVDFNWTPTSPQWSDEITFTPTATDPDGDINKATFEWDFGDGTPTVKKTGPKVVKHMYGKGGRFTVKLTVTDEGGAVKTVEKTVAVAGTVVDFTWAPERPKVGELVTFIASPKPNTYGFGYRWDFGDGAVWPAPSMPPDESNVANHIFHSPSEEGYTVKLTVTARDGTVIGTAQHRVKVVKETEQPPENKPPVVTALSVVPDYPEVDEQVTFTATAEDNEGDPITEYEWDFGDETPKETTDTNTVTHTYQKEGLYTVKVRAKDAGSEEFGDWKSLDLYVRPKGKLIGAKVLDNPATTRCRIQIFVPPDATDVKITILDLMGRPILEESVSSGTFTWDLKDGQGRQVPDGLYFFLVTATYERRTVRSETGRILVLR